MTIELTSTWLIVAASVLWLLLSVLLGRWTYRSYRDCCGNPDGVVAALAAIFMPITLLVWLCSVGNQPKGEGS